MYFLKISNADMSFGEKTLTQKFYTTNKALPITEQVQIIYLKEFVIVMLDANIKTFVVHVAIQEQKKILVHSEKYVQIEVASWVKVQVGALLFNEALTIILVKYINYNNIILMEKRSRTFKKG